MAGPQINRLAIVLSHPTQYYSPWFRWLAAHTEVQLRVFYLWDFGITRQRDPKFRTELKWDVDLLSGYDSELVPNRARHPGTERFGGLRNPSLFRQIRAWGASAILVFGYNHATHLQLIGQARLARIPLLFRGDSHLLGREHFRGPKAWLLRWLYRQFAAVTYVGAANRDYFRTLGVPDSRLFFAPHSVDAEHFQPTPARQQAAQELRQQLGLSDRRIVLFAGKLVPEKQPAALLQAFGAVADPRKHALVFVGEGSEKARLQETAATSPLAPAIRFLPFANQSEMPVRYLMGDVFCLPSGGLYETWGLAVNEAMHMGRPCLVSDRVGCQRDLITDGDTGWVFRAEDAAHLRQKLTEALQADLPPMTPRISARIAGYTYAQTTAGVLAALASLAPQPAPAP